MYNNRRSFSKSNSNGSSNNRNRNRSRSGGNGTNRNNSYRGNSSNRGGRSFGGNNRGRNRFNFKTVNVESFINRLKNEPKTEEYVVKSTFNDFAISSSIKQNIANKGFSVPTAIQDQAIPIVLSGKDLIGLANTGTGKTAAYLIPLIEKVIKNNKEKVLILAPTRELASQINADFYALRKDLSIYSVLLTGGANIQGQIKDLYRNYNFIIATPGRLKDLMNRRKVDISKVNTLVLDEVDRMLDMGFIVEIKALIKQMPTNRQSLFFSATLGGKIEQLINESSTNPVKINVISNATATHITHSVVKYSTPDNKIEVLHTLLRSEEFKKVLIFGRTKVGVNNLGKELRNRGFKVEEIHGNKRQSQRNRSLSMFKKSEVDILVATDVASRGIDVTDITHVINFELPENYEDYIHRIGRTGRANKTGAAISFVKV